MGREDNPPEGTVQSGVAERGDSFGRLSNAIRLEIVQALATDEPPLSYTELFEQVSVADRGQFNYHLRLLVDEYVRKTDDGYRLEQSGRRAANVLASNALAEGTDREFQPTDSKCGACGHSTVEIGYRSGEAVVRCPDCGRDLTRFDFPPAAANAYATREFVNAFARRTRAYFRLADGGTCPFCAHSLSTEIRPSTRDRPDAVPVVGDCSACSAGIRAPVGLLLSTRPEIESAFAGSGSRLREIPFWEFEWCTFEAPAVRERDPLVVELTIESPEGPVTVQVDRNVEIRRIDR